MSTHIEHVTFHVPAGTFDGAVPDYGIDDFFDMLGCREIEPEEAPIEGEVRWWQVRSDDWSPYIHCIEGPLTPELAKFGHFDQPVLGHICIETAPEHFHAIMNEAMAKNWLERNSGSGRIWVRFKNIRVEVRPHEVPSNDRPL